MVGGGGGTVSNKLENRGDMSSVCTTSAVQVCVFSALCVSGTGDFKSCEK